MRLRGSPVSTAKKSEVMHNVGSPSIQIPPPRPPALASPGSSSACEPDRGFIIAQLRLRRNYTAIYKDLFDQFGYLGGYNSVKRFAGKLREIDSVQFDRLEFATGEEAQLHEQAWRYFGGTTQYVVLDNLIEGVITPDLYEPELNRVYAMALAHYGVVGDPARIRDPNRKGSVENSIGHTSHSA